MKIIKFGGTSIANADCIVNVSEIIARQIKEGPVGIVLSAVSGTTNFLVASIKSAIDGRPFCEEVDGFYTSHHEIINKLALNKENFPKKALEGFLKEICDQYTILLKGVQLLKECPDKIYCQILSLGERVSARMMLNLLDFQGISTRFIDASDFIKTKGNLREAIPILDEIKKRFGVLKNENCLLMSGFVGSDSDGNLSLLGRDGADYSASLMAVALEAQSCEIWTDVDGIYTADPRQVSDAQLISQMSYGEAMELAFYGAKVLHPKTTATLMTPNIPLYIKNSFNPSSAGTKIADMPKSGDGSLIRAVSCRRDVVLITIQGAGMKGAPGIAAQVFDAVAKCGASIVLISQASSECSICFCVSGKESDKVLAALNEALALEQKLKIIETICAIPNQAIICVVGDNMKKRVGVSGKVFSALSHAAINVVAIAQGSSEQSISVVVDGKQSDRAVHAIHQSFFHTLQPISLYLVGVGSVGSELVDQVKKQYQKLLDNCVEIKLCLIANSKQYLHNPLGIDLSHWQTDLKSATELTDIKKILAQAMHDKPLNGIFVDCTSSQDISAVYTEAFKSGLHVVTANKKANSDNLSYYRQLRLEADKNKRLFLYETNVGAGLPTIDAFKHLIKSGDSLLEFSGILSGSLSFIFGALDEGMRFSEAVRLACEKKFTEPDPRDDLSGMDVARKVLILARETGMAYELKDITMNAIFPEDFDASGSVNDFLKNLKTVDDYFSDKITSLKQEQKVLRFVGSIDDKGCSVGIRAVGPDHPLYAIKNGENAFAFLTKRYSPIPLVVRGYGAGVEVTASGLFADILKTVDIN